MNTCHCTLPYFYGSDVCTRCWNNKDCQIQNQDTSVPSSYYLNPVKIQRIIKTIDRYDSNNTFIGREVITEEIQYNESIVYTNTINP